MSHRRKRSKGSWSNPVKGAMVINKGGGGGEKVRGTTLEAVQQRAEDMRASRHLIAGNATEERDRSNRISHRSLQGKSGMAIRLRSDDRGSRQEGDSISRVMELIREERG